MSEIQQQESWAVEPVATRGTQFQVPASLEVLNAARERSVSMLREYALDGASVDSWALVFTEAFVNAVEHGAENDESKTIGIQWKLSRGRIELEILDPGPGVPDSIREKIQLPADPMYEGGRGLFLIYSLCDDCRHWVGKRGHLFQMGRIEEDLDPETTGMNLLNQTMEELSSSYESLSAFYRLGESLIQSDRVTAFLESALNDLKKLVPADMLQMRWEENLHPAIYAEVTRMEASFSEEQVSETIEKVVKTGEDFVFENPEEVKADPFFNGYSSGCCLLVQASGHVLGTLIVARKKPGSVFIAKDLSTLRTYTDLFGIAIAHAGNAVARTQEQQALREIEIAAELQNTLVPTAAPEPIPERTLFLKRLSARSVSGDYAEAIQLDDGRLLLVIVDVMGKGVSAAFLAGMLRTAVRLIITTEDCGLLEMVHRINLILCDMLGDLTLFATAGFILIARDNGSAEIANAGHCPIFSGRPGVIDSIIEPSGPPLGIFIDQVYTVEQVALEPGSWLMMVTDGLFEWELEPNEIWNWDRFQQFVEQNLDQEGEAFWDKLQKYRNQKAQETQLEDDQTLLYWKRKR